MNVFPFDAVVGQDDAKLALRLAAADPLIGGVLLRGQKGSAKTTLARGLAAVLGDAPFIELPLGATEDRVVGTLDTHAALTGGEIRFQSGLLAAADGGVLYVDEINLLADHLVDVLLDVAVTGENIVERDGISHRHPARFVLVGSMNPEEGELRPQLLDRFGLCVQVEAPLDIADRAESVRRRLAFDAGQLATVTSAAPIPASPVAGSAALSDEVIHAASRLALEVGAEGLRADLVLCRAAVANATLEGRAEATVDDLRRVAPLVLAHRSRRQPFDPPMVGSDELDRAMNEALDPPPSKPDTSEQPDAHPASPGEPSERPFLVGVPRRPPVTKLPKRGESPRGRVVGDRDADRGGGEIAIVPTVRAIAQRRGVDADAIERKAAHDRAVRRSERLDGSTRARRRSQRHGPRAVDRRLPAPRPCRARRFSW
jgi:magnesium chelatase subunit D